MKILGDIQKLIQLIFAKNGNEVTVEPDAGTGTLGDVTFTLPGETGPSSHEITTNDSSQTFTNKTIDVDAQTSVTNIADANIKSGAAIDAAKIHDGSVSNTEFGYLDGVTSSIQTQIDTQGADLADHESETTGAHAASAVSYDNATSGLTAVNAQTAIDEVEGRVDTAESDISTNTGNISTNTGNISTNTGNISTNTSDIADLRTAQGTSDGDTDLGTFTGTTISDNTSVKTALQELETSVETKAADADLTSHTGDATVHFTEASIDHANILNVGTNTHAQIDTHIAATAAHGVSEVMGTSGSTLQSVTYLTTDKSDNTDDFE